MGGKVTTAISDKFAQESIRIYNTYKEVIWRKF